MERIALPCPARMRTSRRDRGPTGRCRRIAAGALSLALAGSSSQAIAEEPRGRSSAEVDARELSRSGDHMRAAEKWAEVAATAAEPTTRTLAAFQGYQEWLAAYEQDHDPRRLCAARTLLGALLDRGDLDADVRGEARSRIADLDARIADHDDAAVCEDPAAQTPGKQPPSGLLPAYRPSRSAELLPVPSTRTTTITDRGAEDPRRRALALTISSGVTLGVGASLLGVAAYGIVVDARSAAALFPYTAKKHAGELTDADWTRIDALREQGLAGARLAKITGIAGGVAVITGAALLIHARRVRQRSLALYPDIGRTQAGLGLRGHF